MKKKKEYSLPEIIDVYREKKPGNGCWEDYNWNGSVNNVVVSVLFGSEEERRVETFIKQIEIWILR